MADAPDTPDNALPTSDELRACLWAAALAASPEKDCRRYSTALLRDAEVAKSAGNTGEYRALRFLGHLTSMAFRLDQPAAPLVAYIRMGTSRSAALEDFEAEHLALLKGFAPTVSDGELKARVCDVLWLGARDHVAAAEAVDAYLQSAATLEHPEHWTGSVQRLERAAQLAVALRRMELVDRVLAVVDGMLQKYAGSDPLYLSAKLMELLLKYRKGDPAACARIAETAAAASEAKGDLHRASTYLELKATWQRRANDAAGANETLKRIGENWASLAEKAASGEKPAFSDAVMHAQRALEALQKAAGTRDRRRVVHAALLRYQEGSLNDLKRFEVTRDVTHLVKRAEELVAGKQPGDALVALALAYEARPVKDLRKQVEHQAREHPFSYLFSSVVLTNQGRVAAQRGSLLGGTPEESEAAVHAEMCRYLTTHHSLLGQTLIEPARRRIVFEHEIREGQLQALLAQSPFVPPGRDAIYAKGLWAGLQGDFIAATHLLIPQIEHSVRVLLSQRIGVLTSNLKSDGAQDELDLNTTLRMPEINDLVGEDIAFDLRALLIERFGSNLRNRFAHGLMHQTEFMSYAGAYLWWVCLYLCLAPLVLPAHENSDAESNPKEAGSGEVVAPVAPEVPTPTDGQT